MDILDDMGVSKLSANVNYSFKCSLGWPASVMMQLALASDG